MGLRFRKSIQIMPGVKLNLNKKSAGITLGGKGVHYTVNSKGRKTASVGIPGTGLYYSSSVRSGQSKAADHSMAAAMEPEEIPAPKSRLVALLWCVCFGYFGAHRFYVGKKGTGYIYLFTVGLLGIGWFIDLFKIIFGTFTDAYGQRLASPKFPDMKRGESDIGE